MPIKQDRDRHGRTARRNNPAGCCPRSRACSLVATSSAKVVSAGTESFADLRQGEAALRFNHAARARIDRACLTDRSCHAPSSRSSSAKAAA